MRQRTEAWHFDIPLYMFIWEYGGLHRDREYWDPRLSYRENARRFRRLDRREPLGHRFDVLAREIASMFPEFRIETGRDLWDWLQLTPCGRA
jgi:hypothetical protein